MLEAVPRMMVAKAKDDNTGHSMKRSAGDCFGELVGITGRIQNRVKEESRMTARFLRCKY